ncbi:MAG: glycosyltransferase family 9 protein, partial [Proteobacteria bacterium]|nr:glycosyltransferase family 9 protein [Pseudomonadota bacterium]
AFARQPFYRLKIGLGLRRLAPAIVVNDSYFRRALMADSLVWMSGADRKISSLPFINEATRTEFTYYLSQVDQVIDTGPYPTHEIFRHYRFLSALLGQEVLPAAPRIDWPGGETPIAGDRPYVVLNPGSNEPGRRWPFNSYLDTAAHFLEDDYRIVIVGGRDERPGDYRDRFGERDDIIDLTGKTGLSTLVDIMQNAAMVISNDTGPAHISIALGTPTVVVVGGGHFGSFVPYPEDVSPANARFVYERMECYHCFWRCDKRRSKVDVFPCISAVGVDEVWRAVRSLQS